jgi:hypothetical protein
MGKLHESSSLGLTRGRKSSVMYILNMGGCKGSTVHMNVTLTDNVSE